MCAAYRATARCNGFVINGSCYIVAFFVGGLILGLYQPIFMTIAFRQKSLSCRYNDHHWHCHGRFCRALRDSTRQEPLLEPWTKATIDYSGANEYMEAHYGNHPLLKSSWKVASAVSYFDRVKAGGDKIIEPIYNARELRKTEENNKLLKKYGMTLVNSPTRVMYWKDRKHIEDVYIEELENILPTLFSSEIQMHCFWNPMLRGEDEVLSPPEQQSQVDKTGQQEHSIPTANIASAVHIDTDVGAYDSLDDFLAIVEKNQVKGQGDDDTRTFERKRCEKEIIQNKKRFAVVNFWRSTNRDVPVTTSPLAILSTRYEQKSDTHANTRENSSENNTEAIPSTILGFPNLRPDMKQSKWYTFPNMTSNEILVFYQYDRLATQPSDLWHCAISVNDVYEQDNEEISKIDSKGATAPRESFDIRALVVFDEIVDEDKDRYHPNRLKPVLSFEDSGCFCDEQAENRSQ